MKTILITGTSSGPGKKLFQFQEWNLILNMCASFQDYALTNLNERGGVQ